MKMTSAFNGFTTIVILGIIIVVFLAESNADRNSQSKTSGESSDHRKDKKSNCLQYGHSCWGGHGKRDMPIPVQRQAPISEDWSLPRSIYPNYKRSPMSEIAFILNRPPLEVAKEIAMLRHASISANSDDGNDRRNIPNPDNNEEQSAPRNMFYLTDQVADPENNLLQILNDNEAVKK